MKNFLAYAVVAAAFFAAPQAAFAGDNVADRTAAIQLCRAEVASQAGVEADTVRLDQVALRARVVRVDFDLWRDGNLQNIRCEVSRAGGELQIASITPALQTVAVAR
jgi:hypothetical protein